MISPFSPIASAFNRLPYPLRIGLMVLGLSGVIYGFGYYLRRFFHGAGYVILIGIVAIILLLLLFRWFLKWRAKRRGEGLNKALESHGSAAPEGVSQASARAKLDLLRTTFEEGISKFRAAGKNVYSLPWYVIVGESGSGKTEAVRHSSIGFPPGLQDPQQGVGGTINMNWWFTDRAVILDTAGRVVFEEVESGSTSEWLEFLKLLRSYRRNCPLNGLFLVIPADTIITDNANQINAKAQKIAEQLHLIQRTLGVRFPVFVIITKCDLVTGFREFFENVTDPRLQAQMLGWSSPAPLDQHFNAELVDRHLRVVCNRLRRRRLAIISDPVHTEDPNARRTGQVDSLFAFPRNLSRIASRLQQYLTTVFAGGEWTGKPLFLRGIYFTSSMREGNPLDEGLAQALGIPIQSIQDNRAWEPEQSYFLKDVFVAKAFREQGLVTGAAHVGRQHRFRKAMVLLAGLASVLLLGLMTWYGARTLKRSIGTHADYWGTAANTANWCSARRIKGLAGAGDPDYWRPILSEEFDGSPNFLYSARPIETIEEREKVRTARFHTKLIELANTPIEVPWIFWLASHGRQDFGHRQAQAQRILFEAGVIRPVFDAARRKLKLHDQRDGPARRPKPWPTQATEALIHLIRLEGPDPRLDDAITPLFQFVLYHETKKDERLKQLQEQAKDAELIQAALDANGAPPPAAIGKGSQYAHDAIRAGVRAFIRHWIGSSQQHAAAMKRITHFRDALDGGYNAAEQLLFKVDDDFDPAPDDAIARKAKEWTERLNALKAQRARVAAELAAFPGGSILDYYQQQTRGTLEGARTQFEDLKARTGVHEAHTDDPVAKREPWRKLYTAIDEELNEALKELERDKQRGILEQDLKRLGQDFLNRVSITEELWRAWTTLSGGDSTKPPPAVPSLRLYEARMLMYLLADAERSATDDDVPLAQSIPQALRTVDAKIQKALGAIEYLTTRPDKESRERFDAGAAVASFTCKQLARPQRVFGLLHRRLAKAPKNAEQVAALVPQRAKLLPPLTRPRVPLTDVRAGPFELAYHPTAVAALLTECKDTGAAIEDIRRTRKIAPAHGKIIHGLWTQWHGACNDYVQGDYRRYWATDVPSFRLKRALDWPAYQRELRQITSTRDALGTLAQIGKTVENALGGDVAALVRPDTQREFQASIAKLKANLDKYTGAAGEIHLRQCAAVLDKWRELGGSAVTARRTILGLGGNESVKSAYLPFGYSSPEEIVDKYWTELTLEGLRRVVSDTYVDAQVSLRLLARDYGRFPLAAPRNGRKPLTPQQLDEARRLTAKLVADPRAGVGFGATEVDKLLDRLRSFDLSPKHRAWVAKLAAVLSGLPDARSVFKCRILIAKSQPAGRATFSNTWVHIRANQGRVPIGKDSTVPDAEDRRFAEVSYAGEDLAFLFYRNPTDHTFDRSLKLTGPWAILRLLHPGEAFDPLHPREGRFKITWQPDPKAATPARPTPGGADPPDTWPAAPGDKKVDAPKTHTIVITATDDANAQRKLRLRLDLQKGLPRSADWPVTPGH